MADSSEQQQGGAPQLCIGGCGFFGHPSFGNYCSVCFKQGKAPTPTASAIAIPSPTVTTPSPVASPESVSSGAEAAASSSSSSSPATPARPVQKNIQKCWQCSKRVGLLGFKCKCDYVFCSNHRLSHAHNCIVDYQTLARGELETRLGDAIVPKKLERL